MRSDGTLNRDVRDPSVATFGFGRRICPGQYMALDSMWFTIANVLALFEIKKEVDEDGKEIIPDGEYDRGFLWYVLGGFSRSLEHLNIVRPQPPEALPLRHQATFGRARSDAARVGAPGYLR